MDTFKTDNKDHKEIENTNKTTARRRIKQMIEWGWGENKIKEQAPEKLRIKESIPVEVTENAINDILN